MSGNDAFLTVDSPEIVDRKVADGHKYVEGLLSGEATLLEDEFGERVEVRRVDGQQMILLVNGTGLTYQRPVPNLRVPVRLTGRRELIARTTSSVYGSDADEPEEHVEVDIGGQKCMVLSFFLCDPVADDVLEF